MLHRHNTKSSLRPPGTTNHRSLPFCTNICVFTDSYFSRALLGNKKSFKRGATNNSTGINVWLRHNL